MELLICRSTSCFWNWPLDHILTLLNNRFFAKRAFLASGVTGKWSFQGGWLLAWRTSEPAGGTARVPVASEKMKSPGALVGAAPATTPGTKARVWRSRTSPCAPPSASTWTSRRASWTSTQWRRVLVQPRRSSFCSRSRAPSGRSWSQASGLAHSPAAWSQRRMTREIKQHSCWYWSSKWSACWHRFKMSCFYPCSLNFSWVDITTLPLFPCVFIIIFIFHFNIVIVSWTYL